MAIYRLARGIECGVEKWRGLSVYSKSCKLANKLPLFFINLFVLEERYVVWQSCYKADPLS